MSENFDLSSKQEDRHSWEVWGEGRGCMMVWGDSGIYGHALESCCRLRYRMAMRLHTSMIGETWGNALLGREHNAVVFYHPASVPVRQKQLRPGCGRVGCDVLSFDREMISYTADRTKHVKNV